MGVAARRVTAVGRRCPACDYDLAGHEDGRACPECGTSVPAGLRSVKVWSGSELPSVVALATYGLLGGLFLLGVYASLRSGNFGCLFFFVTFLAIGGLIAAAQEARKLRCRSEGTTDSTLHFSPAMLGLWTDGSMDWHRWDNVVGIHMRRRWRGRWVLMVTGRWSWMVGRPRLVTAVVPAPRSDIAIIRNSLRRLHASAVSATGARRETKRAT
jgi:hypothetical protein